ncbi:hypothetical protein C8J57DRAFT_1269870 [Mycena rebaudengoi]|nr:hypothetical protein C8J57DRAFT_1269870 [Mycena rebaudengoi]
MFVAIIGTRFSGKSAVEDYLVSKEFQRVRIVLDAPDGPDSEEIYSDSSSELATTLDLTYDSPHVASKHLSFLSMGPATPMPADFNLKKTRNFSSAPLLLDYVTRNWRVDFVTVDICTRDAVEAFAKRPFFLLVNVDAPLLHRYYRSNTKTIAIVFGTGTPQESAAASLHSISDLVNIHISNNFLDLAAFHSHLDDLNLLDPGHLRPQWDAYFMVSTIQRCCSLSYHTVRLSRPLRRPKLILSSILTRYNGTPRGVTNCNEGGCDHCNGTTYPGSVAYDCVCLHAEENALLEAGRERVGQGSVLYCNTLRSSTRPLPMLIRIYRCPCLKCTIKIIQTGVKMVVYNLSYKVDDASARLLAEAGVELRRFQPVRK